MPKLLYCWRCKIVVPMLDDAEWAEVFPSIEGIKRYRDAHGMSLVEAKDYAWGNAALERYQRITGFRAADVRTIWHHRINSLGPPCSVCGKPLRTPRAKLCAECGATSWS